MRRDLRELACGGGLMGAAELVNRLSRLVTAVILARHLGIRDFAVLAIALTTYELVRLLTHNGFGARIVQATDAELEAVCAAIHRLNWGLGGLMFVLQCALAWPIARYYGAPEVAPMLVVLASVYLIYPMTMVSVFLVQRQNRLGLTATMTAVQVSCDNLLTAGLALAGMGPWAAILPKLVVAPLWVMVFRRAAPWRPKVVPTTAEFRAVVAYSRCVLGAEALNTLRMHADKLVIGGLLGLNALGLYAFAVNAGVGITTSLVTAAGTAILPFLCRSTGDLGSRFRTSTLALTAVVVPIVILQAALAPWYVPLVFGAQWAPAVTTLSLLALSAAARPLLVTITQLLRATGAVGTEFEIAVCNAVLALLGLVIGARWGMAGAAAGLLAASLLPLPYFLWLAQRRVLPRRPTLAEAVA